MAAKSGTGLNKNVAGALAYVLGPVTGVVFLILEKDPFVRFHAVQSIVIVGGTWALLWILPFTIILAIFIPIVAVVGFILYLLLIYKAWQGEEWEVPFLGKLVRQLVAKVG
jgi:uncharacterized membrane protein